MKVQLEFQFLNGSIKSIQAYADLAKEYYFNSSMVRLKDNLMQSLLPARCISIPQWFD